MPHDYLTVADVLGMHAALMQRYRGAPGVLDPGALKAALFRPQTQARLMKPSSIDNPSRIVDDSDQSD